ncbi:MAG: DUF1272 domain-containing protein [Methylophagaceae bacterium]
MLQLKPNCECCNRDLPAESTKRIYKPEGCSNAA